jgi:Bacterial regulatory helix-turn-helix protein, lysR family
VRAFHRDGAPVHAKSELIVDRLFCYRIEMEIRTLRAFVEVVRQGGFSRAAKTVFATQSTVSKAVKQLEDEIGVPLLDRIGHPASREFDFTREQSLPQALAAVLHQPDVDAGIALAVDRKQRCEQHPAADGQQPEPDHVTAGHNQGAASGWSGYSMYAYDADCHDFSVRHPDYPWMPSCR